MQTGIRNQVLLTYKLSLLLVAWIERLRPELRAVGLVGAAAEALAEARGYICYISSGIAFSFQRFAPFLEPARRAWLLMRDAGWVIIDPHWQPD